jgi:predicted small metal-binding protein
VGEVVRCDCGFEARAANEDGLVAAIQRHAWEAHGMPLSHDEALLLAVHAELVDETTLPTGLARRQTEQHARGEK